jgi:hypothetical protein
MNPKGWQFWEQSFPETDNPRLALLKELYFNQVIKPELKMARRLVIQFRFTVRIAHNFGENDEYSLARLALWRANAVEETRLYVDCSHHACAGHWCKHGNF